MESPTLHVDQSFAQALKTGMQYLSKSVKRRHSDDDPFLKVYISDVT